MKQDLTRKVILINGPAGIGKTSLAIKLGHLLKDKYNDGILWYKIEEDNIRDILLSIARSLGEDIGNISDIQVRGTVVRSLLASKNVLLFLDSAELSDKVNLLIPNSQFCTTILTSQRSQLKISCEYLNIRLEEFTTDESLSLFRNVLKEKYSKSSKTALLKIAEKVGNLPLAVHILAGELLQRNTEPKDLLESNLQTGSNLSSAIAVSYEKISSRNKSVLVSASVFKGKDFSLEAIAYINGLSKTQVSQILEDLTCLSLIERSTKNRFRMHPAIKDFIREKLDYPRSSYLSFIAIALFGFFTVWWIILQIFGYEIQTLEYFASSYFILALYGGVIGFDTSYKWGGWKTLLGRAVFMFSLGLLCQVWGQLAYAYYNRFEGIGVPYPSIGDLGYFGTILIYTYGVFLLARSSGIKMNKGHLKKRLIAIFIPILMLVVGYWMFLRNYIFDFSNPVKIFLDFGYPLGEAVYISIAIIIFIFSRTVLDGIMRSKALLILIALVAQFIADYAFLYTLDTYDPGNYLELLYLTAYFMMTIALLSLRSIQIKVKNN